MEIKLLGEDYKQNLDLYHDFIEDNLSTNATYFSKESITLKEAPNFPIYMAKGNEFKRKIYFKRAICVLMRSYINLPREIHMSETFWHSLMIYKRDYIMSLYKENLKSQKDFKNIVLKNFDWENYIYKCILAAEYIKDAQLNSVKREIYFIDLIIENIDMYNYIIKYPLFRNGQFILNYFQAIDELGIAQLLKSKVKNHEALGIDNRYGRLVFQELNNNYPVVMAPFLNVEELKKEIVNALKNYIDQS